MNTAAKHCTRRNVVLCGEIPGFSAPGRIVTADARSKTRQIPSWSDYLASPTKAQQLPKPILFGSVKVADKRSVRSRIGKDKNAVQGGAGLFPLPIGKVGTLQFVHHQLFAVPGEGSPGFPRAHKCILKEIVVFPSLQIHLEAARIFGL